MKLTCNTYDLKAAETDSFLVSSPVSPLVFKDDSSTYILLTVRLREIA